MCYELEVLQQIIDNEYEGDAQEVLAHIKTCPICRDTFEKLKLNNEMVEAALQVGMIVPPRQPIGKHSISSMKNEQKRGIFKMNTVQRRWAAAAAGIIICSGLFFFEPVRAKAQDLLKMFRVQEIKGISINQSDINEINRLFDEGNGTMDIENFGEVEISSQEDNYYFESLEGANDIRQVMPNAKLIVDTHDFIYDDASIDRDTIVTLRLDVYKINDFLDYLGESKKLPLALHQKPFTIHTKDALSYSLRDENQSQDHNSKYINITQMEAPTLEIPSDINERELTDTLFSLSFLPDNLQKQLMGISDLTTLPIPYGAAYENKIDKVVRGQKAILIEPKKSERNYFRLYFKEQNTLYIVNAKNCSIDEVLSLIEEME